MLDADEGIDSVFQHVCGQLGNALAHVNKAPWFPSVSTGR